MTRSRMNLFLDDLRHEIRNATANIFGIVCHSRKEKGMSDQDASLIMTHLKKIEKSLDNYIQLLNKGD